MKKKNLIKDTCTDSRVVKTTFVPCFTRGVRRPDAQDKLTYGTVGDYSSNLMHVWFFLQAEVGIRFLYVTGVQTCALPISSRDEATGSWEATSLSLGPLDAGLAG